MMTKKNTDQLRKLFNMNEYSYREEISSFPCKRKYYISYQMLVFYLVEQLFVTCFNFCQKLRTISIGGCARECNFLISLFVEKQSLEFFVQKRNNVFRVNFFQWEKIQSFLHNLLQYLIGSKIIFVQRAIKNTW